MAEEVDLDLTPEQDERFTAARLELGKQTTPEQREAERKWLDAWVAMHREQDPNWVPMSRDLKPRPPRPRPPLPRRWRMLDEHRPHD